jgi:hypothetical protein
MKYKRLERVELKGFNDFGKIVKVYKDRQEYQYLVVPDGSEQHWVMKEKELKKVKIKIKKDI